MSKQGWILPDRKIIHCREMKHLEDLTDEVAAYVPHYKKWMLQLSATQDYCANLVAHGEHGEWHCYDMLSDKIQDKIWRTLIEVGFIRFININCEDTIYFEGSPPALKSSMQFCKDMAKKAGFDYNFRPVIFEVK